MRAVDAACGQRQQQGEKSEAASSYDPVLDQPAGDAVVARQAEAVVLRRAHLVRSVNHRASVSSAGSMVMSSVSASP